MSSLSPLPSSRTIRGALVGFDPLNPVASVIIFQYNPDTLTRTLQAQTGAEGGDRSEQLRLKGAPVETIKPDVEIDATDQLARDDPGAKAMGVYPQLSALEMLIYPRSALVIANTVLLGLGTIEVIPPMAPLTIFVWGMRRAVPVRLTEFSIAEEAYDPGLNPIRAKVSLGLRVLTYNDLPLSHPGYSLFLAHQVTKEVMATIGGAGNLADVAGGGVNLL
jgi:Contractile injection system tube protein